MRCNAGGALTLLMGTRDQRRRDVGTYLAKPEALVGKGRGGTVGHGGAAATGEDSGEGGGWALFNGVSSSSSSVFSRRRCGGEREVKVEVSPAPWSMCWCRGVRREGERAELGIASCCRVSGWVVEDSESVVGSRRPEKVSW